MWTDDPVYMCDPEEPVCVWTYEPVCVCLYSVSEERWTGTLLCWAPMLVLGSQACHLQYRRTYLQNRWYSRWIAHVLRDSEDLLQVKWNVRTAFMLVHT